MQTCRGINSSIKRLLALSRAPLSHICISTYARTHTHKPVDIRTVTVAPSGIAQLMVAMVSVLGFFLFFFCITVSVQMSRKVKGRE